MKMIEFTKETSPRLSNFIEKTATKPEELQYVFPNTSEYGRKKENQTPLTKNQAQYRMFSRNTNPLFLLLRMRRLNLMNMSGMLLYLSLISLVCALKEQKFAMEPQDQTAVVGSRVTLPCRVVDKAGQLQWTKDDFGLGTHRHLAGYERYTMIGSDDEGDYSLDIRDVTLDDDAFYQCQVSTGIKGEAAIRSRYARLLVLVPPEPPRVLQASTVQTIEDQEVTLECVSVGGKPAAEITWVDKDGAVLTQGVNYILEPMADGRRFTARSLLRLRPRRHNHNQTFTCQAQNTADRAYRAASVKIEVKYAPNVRMVVKTESSKGTIKEKSTVKIVCNANANPNDVTYKWYINNEQIIGNFTDELILNNISRKYNDATIKCEVMNSIGKSSETKTLDVSYGPSFITKPKDIEADEGTSASLECVVEGNPTPGILWLRLEKDRIVRVGKTETINITVSPVTAGAYWCRAAVAGYRDIEAHASVYVRGPPKIMSNKTQYGIEGDSVRIECMSFSVPKPDFVIWTFDGRDISSFHSHEFTLVEETLADGVTKSSLIIRQSEYKHFGAYNCSVSNLYGTDSVEILLLPDKSFPLVIIMSGVASSATIILLTMLIIMLCLRNRRKNIKNDIKKSDVVKVKGGDIKDIDRSSKASDLKMELRQMDGCVEMDLQGMSETDFHSNLQLGSHGLSLGPLSMPVGYDNELINYQRYSTDFADPQMQMKVLNGAGYIGYVDYTRDYLPPALRESSLAGSVAHSLGASSTEHRELREHGLNGFGPDLIPMNNPGMCISSGGDIRYSAAYGNPYLKVGGNVAYSQQNSSLSPVASSPPPYYSVKTTKSGASTSTSPSKPVSKSASQLVVSTTPSNASTAQPQVPKTTAYTTSKSTTSTSRDNSAIQITAKGKGKKLKNGTHV